MSKNQHIENFTGIHREDVRKKAFEALEDLEANLTEPQKKALQYAMACRVVNAMNKQHTENMEAEGLTPSTTFGIEYLVQNMDERARKIPYNQRKIQAS